MTPSLFYVQTLFHFTLFIFLKKNYYLYITFKHYNTKPKKQISKREYYYTRKARMMILVLLYMSLICSIIKLIFFSFPFLSKNKGIITL